MPRPGVDLSSDTFVLVDLEAQWAAVVRWLQGHTRDEKLVWMAERGDVYGFRTSFVACPAFASPFGLLTRFSLDEQGELRRHSRRVSPDLFGYNRGHGASGTR